MSIIVTGGNGLVGSAFPSDCIRLSRKDADLTNWDQTFDLFQRLKPDVVIHCAAKVGGVKANMDYPADFCRENLLINQNVLEACRLLKVRKFVGFLSTCIFPDGLEILNEENVHEGPPHHSNFAYAYAKRMLDIQVSAYNQQYGTKYFCVIPCNIYGPNDNFNLETSHVVPALVRKFCEATNNVTVWGTGKPLREFIYSKDVAAIILKLVENYHGTKPVILSPGIEHSIKSLVEIISKAVGFNGEISWDHSKPDGQFRKHADNSYLMDLIPDFTFTSLEEGIKETVTWYRRNFV